MPIATVSSKEARARWRDILDTVDKGTADVVIERYGKPIAALIAYEDFAALLEALEDLRDGRIAQAAYEEWQRDPSTAISYEQFRADMIAKGLWDE